MAVAKQVRSQLLSNLNDKEWFKAQPDLSNELPLKWEKHGDLILFPEKTFASTYIWLDHPDFLELTCKLLRCNRLARRVGPTQNDGFRSPKVQLLHGKSTLVMKKENGILYSWDLSKCMFSSGNITEKQRIASWNLKGKVVVDLYAGIGYLTLTYLIHSKADLVYACEWNLDAVEALKANLKLNKVRPERCIVLPGDNRETCPKNVADHVNLGLIPSSEDGWRPAVLALKRDIGGVLHIHGNVDTKIKEESVNNYEPWSANVRDRIKAIICDVYLNEKWSVVVKDVVKIKSYAPNVDHLVADVVCVPVIIDKSMN